MLNALFYDVLHYYMREKFNISYKDYRDKLPSKTPKINDKLYNFFVNFYKETPPTNLVKSKKRFIEMIDFNNIMDRFNFLGNMVEKSDHESFKKLLYRKTKYVYIVNVTKDKNIFTFTDKYNKKNIL